MSSLYLLEPDAPGPEWAPFAGVRPIAELRAGAWLIRERWEAATGLDTAAVFARHAEGFHDVGAAPVRSAERIAGPAIVALSTFAPSGARIAPEGAHRLAHQGTTVGWIVPAGERWEGPHDRGAAAEVEGLPLRGAFDLITALETLLGGDCDDFIGAPRSPVPEGSIVLGDPSRVIARGASVEPGVVFDVRAGAVVLEEGVEVRHGTRLEGPLFAGKATRILGGVIRQCAFGPDCRVHGELSTTVFVGYSNKSHDGFVGHSVLGPWVNLGAGTITSNLKSTYGLVRLEAGGVRIETGRLNVGTLFGDHAKTAIGTLLSTGTIVSAGANLFGETPPKYVPPFAWGSTGVGRLTEEGFLRIAERVLGRRKVAFTPEQRASLQRIYARGAES
jgi:UDP-N-acetylglucosamine diphosphorylase/glucosamine-1-phosphate N-acetyltransferase